MHGVLFTIRRLYIYLILNIYISHVEGYQHTHMRTYVDMHTYM